jgi:hypothetical protein
MAQVSLLSLPACSWSIQYWRPELRRVQGKPCTLRGAWRRERDSNPRSRFKRDTRLAGEPLRPLGHLSVILPTMYYSNLSIISTTPEASCAEKICLWKFSNILLCALHLPFFYNLHKKLVLRAYGDMLIELPHIGAFVIYFQDSLCNQYKVSRPPGFSIHKHNTYCFSCHKPYQIQGKPQTLRGS